MTEVEIARLVIGIIGNIISFFLFVSPMPTFVKIIKKKSVEDFKSDPYLATAVNCMFWVLYAFPFIHPDSTLVITINSIGLGIELSYLIIFSIYCDKKQRVWIFWWLVAEVVFTACIAFAALQGEDTHRSRSNFVGIFCVVFGIFLYASPLTIMRRVVRTKSVEYMPFWLSVASFANGVIWTVYSCLKFDPYIFTGNSVGTILGAGQLVLYWYYYKKTPTNPDDKHVTPTTQEVQKKPTEVEIACV